MCRCPCATQPAVGRALGAFEKARARTSPTQNQLAFPKHVCLHCPEAAARAARPQGGEPRRRLPRDRHRARFRPAPGQGEPSSRAPRPAAPAADACSHCERRCWASARLCTAARHATALRSSRPLCPYRLSAVHRARIGTPVQRCRRCWCTADRPAARSRDAPPCAARRPDRNVWVAEGCYSQAAPRAEVLAAAVAVPLMLAAAAGACAKRGCSRGGGF